MTSPPRRRARRAAGAWRLAVRRSAAIALHALLWLAYWYAAFGLIYALVYWPSARVGLLRLPAGWQLAVELGWRALLAGPLLFWVLLALHPVRTRRWMSARLLGALRRFRRTQPTADSPPRPLERLAAAHEALAAGLPAPAPISRRRFLGESVLLGSVLADALFIEPHQIGVIELDMPVRDLPERFHGMRIAQMSDLHLNGFTAATELERAVGIINGLRPDAVVLTGDFVDRDARFAADAAQPFRQLTAPEGVFSILGNHDYYTGDVAAVRREIERAGLGLLVNQSTVLRRGADRLTLIGLDDPRHTRNAGSVRMSRESIEPGLALLDRLRDPGPRLVLLHNPILVPELMRRYDLDLFLCGHTHGGQFQVPILTDQLVENAEFFVKGRYDLGRSQVYVNRGFGFTGPPIRFRVTPEITLLRLVPASAPA
ncbi:MAG TPA: metallophosphoesterase [Herpetosiphonaceae bacterium]